MKSVPVILQREIAECGLACVAMVSGYYGRMVDVGDLRRHSDPGTRGSTMKDLVEVAESLGLTVKSLKAGMRQLDKLTLPAIIHWNLVHYVVLVSIGPDEYVIHDPGLGRRELTEADFSRSFTGLVQELEPSPDFSVSDTRKGVPLSWVVGKDRLYARLLVAIFGIAFAMQMLVASVPLAGKSLIEDALAARDQVSILVGLAAGAVGVVMYCALLWVRSTTSLYLNARLDSRGTQKLISKMLAMPYEFFARRDIGLLLSRFSNLVELRRLLTQGLAESAIDGLVSLVLVLSLTIYVPSVGVVAMASVMCYAAIRAFVRERQQQRVGEMFQAAAGEHASLIETLSKIVTVKANALESMRESFWVARFTTYQNAVIKKVRLDHANSIAMICVFGAAYGFAALLIVNASLVGKLSISEGFTVFALMALFISRSTGFVDKVFELLVAKLHLDNLADVVHNTPEDAGANHGRPGVPCLIELREVGFRYSDKEPFIFRNVSLRIEAGSCVAITGPSGCGKSTLLSLMLGLRRATEGQVIVDGVPIENWNLKQLRRRVGSVLQGDHLFAGSIEENVTLFDVEGDPERVDAVLDSCALRDAIQRLPMGKYTMISDTPEFSGGERQRLLLARALYKLPGVLVLDEATSHLDEETESQVNSSVRDFGATRVMVAHRRQTIELADVEVVMGRSDQLWSTILEVRKCRRSWQDGAVRSH